MFTPRRSSVALLLFFTLLCQPTFATISLLAKGYSVRDNDFYSAWDDIARDRDRFTDWMREHL